ncbi:MAG: ATP-dependent DNA helicase [Candidatus Spechtbacterales bacterium]|nr:ATP-dependent DNA helicase [Candidatus Spechtbacterales bacterium]
MPLTKKQKEAVESEAPATMVIAGPGTGKTHILASRIEHLVKHQDIPAENILSLTFTKSGARAMKERVISFIGEDGYKIETNTFHGFAASLIDENPDVFGYRHDLKEATDIDRAKILRDIFDELNEDHKLEELHSPHDKYFYYNNVSNAIKTIKREGFTVEEFKNLVNDWQEKFDNIPDEEKISTHHTRKGELKRDYEKEQRNIDRNKELALIYEKYQEILKKRGLYDYEDMIIKAIEGLKDHEDIRHEIHNKYGAILVDEYQDTSGAQNRLLFLLIPENPNVFIVGDDDQAIYRFQGATIANFQEFLKKYPETKIVSLEDNFRSPQFLLNAALGIANKNPDRLTSILELPDKVLHAHGPHKEVEEVHVVEFETDMEEHAYILEEIQKLHEEGSEWKDISIITLTNREQKELSDILRHHGIPTALSGDTDALSEPSVSMLFALAQACMNPHDNEDVMTLLLHPATPIKIEDVWKILEIRNRKDNETIYSALKRAIEEDELSNKDEAENTLNILHELSSSQSYKTGAEWLKDVLDKTGLMRWIEKQEEAPYIIANIRALTDEAKRVQAGNPSMRIKDIIDHFRAHRTLGIPLKPSLAQFAFENAVQIMTAHKVKGLEFENVFITHAVHGHWSGKRSRRGLVLPEEIPVQEQNEDDARRVFYVALTRAKKQLYITYAKTYTRGIGGLDDAARETHPSMFISELEDQVPAKTIEKDVKELLEESVKPKTVSNNLQKEIIKNIVSSPRFALNATSYNSFIECPRKFIYEKLFRVPTIKTFALTYGEAIHLALQKHFSTPKEKRGIKSMMYTVNKYVENESTLSKEENEKLLERAESTLTAYYENTLQDEPEALFTEYSFPRGEVEWKNISITGKIDKISPLKPDEVLNDTASGEVGSEPKEVRIVDYKTNSKTPSLNQILGKTKDQTQVKLHRQLLFYKLLSENYLAFNYDVKEFILDFVEDQKQRNVPLEKEAYQEFKDTLQDVWASIQTLEFLKPDNKDFPHCGECKYCTIDA